MIRALLAWLLLALPGLARADWHEAVTPHFVIYADQRPERLTEFAEKLEHFDAAIRLIAQRPDHALALPNRLTVYVVDDTGDVAKLAGARSVAGFYIPRGGGSLAVVPQSSASALNPQSVLLHEYAHHLMWSFSPNSVYPAWYVEGFAETLATADFGRDGSVALGNPPQYRGYGLMSGNWLPAEKLLVADTLKLDAQQREGLYGRGWLLTHYLLFGGKRPGQLGTYLAAINSGKPLTEADAAFGDLRILDKELERYKMGRFAGYRIAPAALHPAKVTLRRLTPGEAATMAVRIRSKVGVNRTTAPAVYTAAQRAATGFDGDAGAQLVLAEAAYDARDLGAAEKAADRAIAADPSRTDGYLYKAMALMAMAREARDRRPETWAAIRRSIAAGNRREPEDPKLLTLYYRSFVDPGFPPSDLARRGILAAFALAPQDRVLRLNVAALHLREGRTAEARTMLAPLVYSPHGGGLAKRASALLARIDAGDTGAAAEQAATAGESDAEEPEGILGPPAR